MEMIVKKHILVFCFIFSFFNLHAKEEVFNKINLAPSSVFKRVLSDNGHLEQSVTRNIASNDEASHSLRQGVMQFIMADLVEVKESEELILEEKRDASTKTELKIPPEEVFYFTEVMEFLEPKIDAEVLVAIYTHSAGDDESTKYSNILSAFHTLKQLIETIDEINNSDLREKLKKKFLTNDFLFFVAENITISPEVFISSFTDCVRQVHEYDQHFIFDFISKDLFVKIINRSSQHEYLDIYSIFAIIEDILREDFYNYHNSDLIDEDLLLDILFHAQHSSREVLNSIISLSNKAYSDIFPFILEKEFIKTIIRLGEHEAEETLKSLLNFFQDYEQIENIKIKELIQKSEILELIPLYAKDNSNNFFNSLIILMDTLREFPEIV
ncbi:hypothetical protein BVX93_00475, partial [bacterium B13(2017)]